MSMLNTKSRTKNVPELFAAGSGALFSTGSPVWLVIPAFNEADVIGQTLLRLPTGIFSQVVVADNGSTDDTSRVARAAGARVISIREKGYGAACLSVLDTAPDDAILIFLQADGSEDASEVKLLLAPLLAGEADLVIGSRVLGQASPGALRPHQRFGNWIATRSIGLLWGQHLTDIGPFRAIRAATLRSLSMVDRSYGWTVEMQVRAARLGLRVMEVPVSYGLRLAGTEKVSGNLRASFLAGVKILSVIARAAVER
ncbi:MAG: glycosyltransferase family 2 protein [Acidobacteriota bacterium]